MLTTVARLTDVRKTLFGLPVTLAGAFLPFADPTFRSPLSLSAWFWMVVAFLSARSSGMAFNQLIDRHFDADNSRTAGRLLPTGEASPAIALLIAATSLLCFLLSCWMIRPLLGQLALIPALLIVAYSYTKRFTSWCHLVLGVILACGPVYAYIAISGRLAPAPLLLGLGLALSIAANDIIYSRQDYTFDRQQGLRSVSTLLGPRGSLYLVGLLHVLAIVCFLFVGLPFSYTLAIVALAIHYLLVDLHVWRIPVDQPLPTLFFRSNVMVALLLFLGVCGGVLWARIF